LNYIHRGYNLSESNFKARLDNKGNIGNLRLFKETH